MREIVGGATLNLIDNSQKTLGNDENGRSLISMENFKHSSFDLDVPAPPPSISVQTVLQQTSAETIDVRLDSFLRSFEIPEPPELRLSLGMGSSIRSRTTSMFEEVSKSPLPPPLLGQSRGDIQPVHAVIEDHSFEVLYKDEVVGKFSLGYHNATSQLKQKAIEAAGVTGSEISWALALVTDRYDEPQFLPDSQPLSELRELNGYEIILKRVAPSCFPLLVNLEDGSKKEISVDSFMTASQIVDILYSLGVEMEEDSKRNSIWIIPLDGRTSRFLLPDESATFPGQTQTRYILKELSSDEENKLDDDSMLLKIHVSKTFSRNIIVKKSDSVLLVLERLLQSLGDRREHPVYPALTLGITSDFKEFMALELYEIFLDKVVDSHVCLMYQGYPADLDTFDGIMDLINDQNSKKISESRNLPSIDELKSLLRALSFSSETLPQEESFIAKNTAVIADFLGVSKESDVKQVQAKLQDYLGGLEDDDKESYENTDMTKKPKIGKVAAMLGIDSETELAKFLLETASKQNSINMTEEELVRTSQRTKSAQKAAKILGVSDKEPKFRHRTVTHYTEDATESRVSGPTSIRRIFTREQDSSSSMNETIKKKSRYPIVNGSITIKVYLMNQTYKTVGIQIDMTAGQLLSMLLEKLNIKEGGNNYIICEDKGNDERVIGENEKIYDIVIKWTDKEMLVFKKKVPKKGSLESIVSSVSDSERRRLHNRRAAKIANIFGISERKATLSEGDNPDLQKIIQILTRDNPKEDSSRIMQDVDKIFIEGWLIYEGESSFKSSANSHWCYIENSKLFVQPKVNDNKQSPISYNLAEHEARRSVTKRNCFEIVSFTHPNKISSFYAESTKSLDAWYAALCAAQKVTHVQVPEPKLSLESFQLHRVLGKGKFGKVFLCTQKSSGRVYAVKAVKKSTIRGMRQVMNNQNENKILRSIRHPFIVSLHYAFQTPDRLFLIMDYVNGGELFFHVNHFGRFSEERVRFYAGEILLALQCLHGKGIVYRDLKLENILLDRDGHVKITDFGLSKLEVDDDDGIIAGTFEYLAPEVIQGSTHSFGADWWAFGLVAFEMLCGYHPFYCEERNDLFKRILHLDIEYPHFIKDDAVDFFVRIFDRNPNERLGSGHKGSKEIQDHPFFKKLDFEALFRKEIEPPFKPDVSDDFNVTYFDDEFTSLPAELSPAESVASFLDKQPEVFRDFTFNGDSYLRDNL